MKNNSVTCIDRDHTWTKSSGTLSTNLYYKDNLHLIVAIADNNRF